MQSINHLTATEVKMLGASQAKTGKEACLTIEGVCKSLFKEWLHELTFEEKEIWLWNALVGMKKIKHRRNA